MNTRTLTITFLILCCVALAYLAGRNAALTEELQQKPVAADVMITQPDGQPAPTTAPQQMTSEKPAAATRQRQNCDVIGNKNSGIYHVPGCRSYNRVREYNREYFCSEEEAERAGYRKARNC